MVAVAEGALVLRADAREAGVQLAIEVLALAIAQRHAETGDDVSRAAFGGPPHHGLYVLRAILKERQHRHQHDAGA
jgi:hypothetical protein